MNTTINLTKRAAWLVAIVGLTVPSLRAADYYWNAADGNWGDLPSWLDAASGGSQPAALPGSGDNVYFSADGVAAAKATLNGTWQVGLLTLESAGYFLDGGTLDLGASGLIRVQAGGTISSMINTVLTAQNSSAIQFATAGQTLTLNGGWLNTSGVQVNLVNAGNADIAKTSTLILNQGTYTMNNANGISNNLGIGDMSNGTGGIILKTGAQIDNYGNKLLIVNNNGVFRMEGGAINLRDTGNFNALTIGWGSAGRFIMTGGTIQQNANAVTGIVMGMGQNSIFDMEGGEINAKSFSIVSQSGNFTSTLNLAGGTVNVRGIGFGGDIGGGWVSGTSTSGTANLNVSGGVLNIGNAGLVSASAGQGTFQYNINLSGGTIGVQDGAAGWSSALNMTLTGSNNSNVTFKTSDSANAAKEIELSGVLSGTGGLIKSGNGTLYLTGSNVYTGLTVINEGKLQLDNGGALTISLADLGGNTAISGAGQLQLGSETGVGILNILTDGIDTDGSWQLIAASLIDASTTFNNFNLQTNGADWTNTGGVWTWNDFIFTESNGLLTYGAIPEPSVVGLLLIGAAGIAGLRLLRRGA